MTDSTTRPPRAPITEAGKALEREIGGDYGEDIAAVEAEAAAPDAGLRAAIVTALPDLRDVDGPRVRDVFERLSAALAAHPAPAPDPIDVLAEGLAARERFASKIGAAPAGPAVCPKCGVLLTDTGYFEDGQRCHDPEDDRKTFSGAQGDACRHCRLSRHSHPEPRLLCPEWALRASDGDR